MHRLLQTFGQNTVQSKIFLRKDIAAVKKKCLLKVDQTDMLIKILCGLYANNIVMIS